MLLSRILRAAGAAVLSLALTVGSGLTMAYFVHDVAMDETLAVIAGYFGGASAQQNALWFSLGTFFGMLLFFYPPGRRDPGILDLSREEYEQRVRTYRRKAHHP